MIKKIENGEVSQVAGGIKPGIYEVVKLKGGVNGMVRPEAYPVGAIHTPDDLKYMVIDENGNRLTPAYVSEKSAREVARVHFGRGTIESCGYYPPTGVWKPFENS